MGGYGFLGIGLLADIIGYVTYGHFGLVLLAVLMEYFRPVASHITIILYFI